MDGFHNPTDGLYRLSSWGGGPENLLKMDGDAVFLRCLLVAFQITKPVQAVNLLQAAIQGVV